MSDEKTEEPTEHKLRKSREEGQMARSQDVAVAASMLFGIGALLVTAPGIGLRLRAVVGLALALPADTDGMDVIYKRVAAMALEAVLAVAPVVVAAAVGAAVGMAAHVGLQITPKALSPKLDNLNPAAGLKKVFSIKSLLNFAQMLVKAVAIGVVMWQGILRLLPLISGAVWETPASVGEIGWRAMVQLLLAGLVVFVVLAPVDFALQKHLFLKGQRMSKDEVKREFKGQEGDPEIKGRRKQLAREFSEESPRAAVARADAVVVNPTHYAVAIRYRQDEAGLPVVLAKGVDEAALRLRGYAEAIGVPVFAHPPLARALYKVAVDHCVPQDLFESVAVVLRWVDEIGARRAAGDAGEPAADDEGAPAPGSEA
ncbi:MAG TPA: type III secretion system export apparatus subunit SctU [Burkholderiaceae bacterium]